MVRTAKKGKTLRKADRAKLKKKNLLKERQGQLKTTIRTYVRAVYKREMEVNDCVNRIMFVLTGTKKKRSVLKRLLALWK